METQSPKSSSTTDLDQPNPKKQKMSTTTTSDDEGYDPAITATATDGSAPPRKPKYKRRKVAIFFAYCGVGFKGMQKNPGAKTIEGDLEEALYHSGAVPEQDRGNPRSYDWSRSARTDKGVSAVGQVVSGRFYVEPPGFVDRLNSCLADQIRIFGYKRVTPSFNAKKFCDRRRYVYLLPVFALDPNCHRDRESVIASIGSDNALVKCIECSEKGRKVVGIMGKRVKNGPSGISSNDVDGMQSKTKQEENVNSIESDAVGIIGINDIDLRTESVLGTVESCISLNNLSALNSENENKGDNVSTTEMDNIEIIETDTDFGVSANEQEEENVNAKENVANDGINGVKELENGASESRETITEGENCNGEANGENGEKRSEFCYSEKEKERFNRILKYYEGTHNFHNFTTRIKAEDPSAKRYIISFNGSSVVNIDGIEFVKCEVVGQSFMLHQIRKMIGLAVAIMRNCAPESLIESAFRQDVNINVPVAPEVGLYLDECFFSSYNQKWEDSHEEVSMKGYADEAEEFKTKYIYSHIASTEQKEGVVALWLHSLNYRNYPDLHVGSVDGSNGSN